MIQGVKRTATQVATRLFHRLAAGGAVAYIGWVGHRNLGDEVVFSSIMRMLSVPLVPYIPGRPEMLLGRLRLAGSPFYRAGILGGGTLVNSGFKRMVQALHTTGPMYMFGSGVGSPGFGTPEGLTLEGWPDILSTFRMIGVRGPRSLQALQSVGVRAVEIIGDPALGYASDEPPKQRRRPRFIVNFSAPTIWDTHAKACLAKVRDLCARLKREGCEVIGVALGDGDASVLSSAVADLPIFEIRRSPERFFRVVSGSTALLGVRLHSAILACCVGVPPILFSYRDKCRDFMESMHLVRNLIPFSEDGADILDSALDRVLDDSRLPDVVQEQARRWRRIQEAWALRVKTDLLLSWGR